MNSLHYILIDSRSKIGGIKPSFLMQDSITKAFLFVIALSTSIIAVELIPVNMVNKGKLLCAERNSEPAYNYNSKASLKLRSIVGEENDINRYCDSL